ncbi:hypothetical protein [Mycobacteroides abscessus]|uniref:hypothetical protein n=1 Tax=Mycobacteroides abscessus TaxID=36809 RepID=UPI00092662AA|nr:hypothetical protein [Mycobacteroides abscessus]MBE5451629.1 hypothetical protein [Mycobacteroides abscessus]MBE5466770.1 hypothetical protein [Mycobacteroides abscessus]MBN7366755.1 hypothetical protein [Mycobacteroides abscessus subsp. abscessus]MBN7450390.1 hypothetical protein [Mycobacteroides abscessus subsp. abscessus]MBN7491001.1 hypothetical protein [Mycobacteroides abscessus subsp. abscessus]
MQFPPKLKKVLKRCFVDHPGLVTSILVIIPAVWWIRSLKNNWSYSWLLGASEAINSGSIVSVYLGLAGVSAISGGFAGVVIVFGLTPQSEIFRRFRRTAGFRMVANWVSIISNAFAAAGLSISAAAMEALSHHSLGATLFLTGCLLFLHSTARCLGILIMLLTLVRNDDETQRRAGLGDLSDAGSAR